jgi:Tfp pilus assembly protein PilE
VSADLAAVIVTGALAAIAYGSYRVHLRREQRRQAQTVRTVRRTFAYLRATGTADDPAAWKGWLDEHREDLAGLHHDRP